MKQFLDNNNSYGHALDLIEPSQFEIEQQPPYNANTPIIFIPKCIRGFSNNAKTTIHTSYPTGMEISCQ